MSNLFEIAPCSALDKSIILSAPSTSEIAFYELATVDKSTVPTLSRVEVSAVVPPPVKSSVTAEPELDVTANDLT